MDKLVFDVGGTLIKYAIMTNDAEIIEKGDFPTPMENQEAFLEALALRYGETKDRVDGIAISIPGNVDSDTGFVHTPGALTYNRETHVSKLLSDLIERKYGRKILVTIENDGKAAALAELWKGNLQGIQNGAVIILGTGIGGGIIANGKILKGLDNFAGEFSFLKTNFNAPGMQDLLAWTASTKTLVRNSELALGKPKGSMNGFDVFRELQEGNEKVWEVFDSVCSQLAWEIYNLTCTLGSQRILIGGGVSKQPSLLENIDRKFQKIRESLGENGLFFPSPELGTTKFFNDSNMIGALYNYFMVENNAEKE